MGNYTLNIFDRLVLLKNRERFERYLALKARRKVLEKLVISTTKFDIDTNTISDYLDKGQKYFYIDGEGSKEIVAYFENALQTFLLIKDVYGKQKGKAFIYKVYGTRNYNEWIVPITKEELKKLKRNTLFCLLGKDDNGGIEQVFGISQKYDVIDRHIVPRCKYINLENPSARININDKSYMVYRIKGNSENEVYIKAFEIINDDEMKEASRHIVKKIYKKLFRFLGVYTIPQ